MINLYYNQPDRRDDGATVLSNQCYEIVATKNALY